VFAATVVLQLVVLYAPRAPSTGDLPIDKVVHAAVFGLVLWAGVRADVPGRPLFLGLVAHAVVSELIQQYLFPHRSGDWTDSVADVTGVLIVTVFLWRRR
jgi:hypothetical protein